MDNKKTENFEYLFLKYDTFNGKKDTRKRNDIVIVKFSDGSEMARIYLNNANEYVDVPNNEVMLNEISHITWTKDSNRENGIFVKSDADETNLKSVLKRHNEDYKYILHSIEDEDINAKIKKLKRDGFIKNNPYANTENPWR